MSGLQPPDARVADAWRDGSDVFKLRVEVVGLTSYKYASVVRLTMDDPRNDHMKEGSVILVAGRHEEEYSYTVLDDEKEGFTDVECESLGVLEADYRMNQDEITTWGADQDEARELAEAARSSTGSDRDD